MGLSVHPPSIHSYSHLATAISGEPLGRFWSYLVQGCPSCVDELFRILTSPTRYQDIGVNIILQACSASIQRGIKAKSNILMAEIRIFCNFCVQSEWKIVRQWHQLICIIIHITWSRNVKLYETSKVNFLSFQLIFIKFSLLFWKLLLFFSPEIKLNLFWFSPFKGQYAAQGVELLTIIIMNTNLLDNSMGLPSWDTNSHAQRTATFVKIFTNKYAALPKRTTGTKLFASSVESPKFMGNVAYLVKASTKFFFLPWYNQVIISVIDSCCNFAAAKWGGGGQWGSRPFKNAKKKEERIIGNSGVSGKEISIYILVSWYSESNKATTYLATLRSSFVLPY